MKDFRGIRETKPRMEYWTLNARKALGAEPIHPSNIFNNWPYYMASSASRQGEPNRAIWLATRAGKMEPSLPLGATRCIPHEKFPRKPYNKSFIEQVCLVKMAGYWPRSFFASLWTSTSSRSINAQEKDLANIQPSWHHSWSITHTYCHEHLSPLVLHTAFRTYHCEIQETSDFHRLH